jgi:hypothetical protein
MQQVALPDATLLPIFTSNKLPNTCNKASANRLKACKIVLGDHDQILEDINGRVRLSYDEASSSEEEEDGEDESSHQEEEEDDDDDDID